MAEAERRWDRPVRAFSVHQRLSSPERRMAAKKQAGALEAEEKRIRDEAEARARALPWYVEACNKLKMVHRKLHAARADSE
jgi:hypothetical protein